MFKALRRASATSSLALCDDYYSKGELNKPLFLQNLSTYFREVIKLETNLTGRQINPSKDLRTVFIYLSDSISKDVKKKTGLSFIEGSMKHKKISGHNAYFFASNIFGAYFQIMAQSPTWAEVKSKGVGGMKNKDFIVMTMFEDFFIKIFEGNEEMLFSNNLN